MSIGDESDSSSRTLLPYLNRDEPSSGSKAYMYHRYVPSYTTNSQPMCSKDLDDGRIVEVSSGRHSLKSRLRLCASSQIQFSENGICIAGASPKQARRIEFDETVSRSRAKSTTFFY